MSQVNYDEMSDRELKDYFLQNRHDRDAMEAYFDRLNQKPKKIIASPGDPDFEEKIQAAIREKLAVNSSQSDNNPKYSRN